jgi:hypothetical protein
MRNFSPKSLTVTVGITTCFGAESILETVKSIRASQEIGKFRLVIVADSVPFSPKLKKKLKQYRVELIENKIPSSQIKKQEQILKMCRTDLIVLTQDDVLFTRDTMAKIVAAFQSNRATTFISIANKALKSARSMENIISVGTDLSQRIARHWCKGDNYLAVIGRVEAFRTEFAKNHFRFPGHVVSSDAFFYLENKRSGGKYRYLNKALVYFRSPNNLTEHLKKSSRFQHSQLEMSQYFSDLDREYQIPVSAVIKGFLEQLMLSPIRTSLYLIVYGYTRLLKLKTKKVLNPLWEAELSTKKL